MFSKKFYLKLLMGLLLVALTVPQGKAAEQELTVAEGTETNDHVPLYDYCYDTPGTISRMVYPADMLSSMSEKTVTKITFYFANRLAFGGGELSVKVGEVNTTAAADVSSSNLTEVWRGSIPTSGATLEFDVEDFVYNGGNLAIETNVVTKGTYKEGSTFYGITATGASWCNKLVANSYNFLPQATFTYEGEAVPYAAKVTPTSLSFGKAMIGSTPSLSVVLSNKGTETLPYSLSGLSAPFSTSVTSGTVASGEQIQIPVIFAPTATENYEGEMVISFPGTDLANITVPVTGAGTNNICDGEDESENLPVWGYWFDQAQFNQMLYPASKLGALNGKKLTKLTFYPKNGINFYSNNNSTVVLKLANVASGTTFSYPLEPEKTTVKTITMPTSAQSGITEWVFEFDETFDYTGGDLLVEVVTTAGKFGATTFYGENQSATSSYYKRSGANAAASNFLPKVTFAYEDSETPATPVITVDPATIDAFSTVVGTSVTATVNVTGENLTGDITATISGDNANCFTADLENGVLTITYNPTAAGNHTATLTLSSAGAQNVVITLNGTATAPVVPTITVNPASVTINTEPYTAGSASFTVTGTNLTNDINLSVSDSGFAVNPQTITAAEAANGKSVLVTYSAQEIGTFNGTITITSGNITKTVEVTANVQEVIAEGTVTPTALNFGEVLVGQTSAAQLVKVSNTGSETFTPSFSIDNPAFSIDEPTAIVGGTSISYNVTFTPSAVGTQTGTLTVSFGGLNHTVSLVGKGTELAGYDITSSEASGVHNFGDVFKDGVATWNVTLTNNGANAVTPVIEGLAAPFSAENVPETLAAGQSATISFKFAPTAIQAYGPTSIVVKFAETTDFQFDYTFRGNGIENTGTLPPSTFDNETYTWTDDNGDTHTSPYSEIATDPNQMIALLKAVYTNKNLPGNYYRGYTADKTPQDEVAYPAIGAIERNYTSGVGYTHDFYDAYGWGMAHDETAYPMSSTYVPGSTYNKTYYVMNPNEYKPNQEGVTLLLVEMKDGVGASTTTTRPTSYASLKNLYGAMFKSVRVIPNSKKVTKTIDVNGTATQVPGTLFKVDCDKMNRFFFLAKGRLRFYPGEGNASAYFLDQVKSSGSGSSYTWYDKENTTATVNPFNMMYEQFSPVDLNNAQESKDVYQLLINMESYDVEHDCEAIPWASTNGVSGHEFNMYGKTSISDDCQDVRDLMFFVPDYRMMYWSGRDKATNSDEYTNYYKQFAPNMGMYVIVQNDITGAQNGTADEYVLNLSWQSNLTDFVPGESGVYTIYQVNDDGTYTQVATNIPSSQTTYQVTVPMQEHGQQVTYVIQGQDNTGFLSLQFSNEESFIIPGTNAFAKFLLDPKAEIYSRFNPADEFNYYANGMKLSGYVDATSDMYVGKTVYFYRKPVTITTEGTTTTPTEGEWTKFAEVTPSNATNAGLATFDQRTLAQYQYGYKANPTSLTIDNNAFATFYDNFRADVSANEHADLYKYIMVVDGTPDEINTKYHSNEITVKVYKTQMSTIDGTFSYSQVEADEDHQLGLKSTAFDIDVEHSSKTEVLRYCAYRWTQSENPAILKGSADAEEDISPSGQASNQGEYYSVYMNGDSFIGDDVYVAQGETGQAKFEDNVPETVPDEYTYAPVVETFTGRADYNTYGAPLQSTATGKTDLTVGTISASTYTFTPEGKTGDYIYYNIPLTATVTIPGGYDIYKVRAWRLVDEEYLGEKDPYYVENRLSDDYLFEVLTDATVGQGIPIGQTDVTRPGTTDKHVLSGTFGAKKLADGESFTATFIIRTYFTKATRDNDREYYITETTVPVPVTNSIITGVINVVGDKQVAGVKYYNLAGVESNEPFNGVNIVVTRYTDGSMSTSKVLR